MTTSTIFHYAAAPRVPPEARRAPLVARARREGNGTRRP